MGEEDRADLNDVLARCPELDMAAGPIRDFGEILTGRLGARRLNLGLSERGAGAWPCRRHGGVKTDAEARGVLADGF
ncbi:hypothetical protein ACGF0K_32500 [Streptomyces sp. NPDC048156]|uniref:hypothetical protein n=1 Tax=Streptomyces sp. NPDC048156 TaxID=3365502 RepID=UPI0037119488